MENKVRVRMLTFGSYMKFFVLVGLALSVAMWVLLILLHANVNFFFFGTLVHVRALTLWWFISITIIIPLALVMILALFGLVSFLPFTLLTSIFDKLSFTALAAPQEPPQADLQLPPYSHEPPMHPGLHYTQENKQPPPRDNP